MAPARYDPTVQVVIAAPKSVTLEWRLVVAEDRVIAASQHAADGAKFLTPGCPENVRAYAQVIFAEVRWRPDPIFMLDACEAEGLLWLVELNGFSCSWLYQCDLSAVVAGASELASRAWERAATAGTDLLSRPTELGIPSDSETTKAGHSANGDPTRSLTIRCVERHHFTHINIPASDDTRTRKQGTVYESS